MRTIIEIINYENEIIEESKYGQYLLNKSEYDDKIKVIKERISKQKWNLYNNEKEIKILESNCKAFEINKKSTFIERTVFVSTIILSIFVCIYFFGSGFWGIVGSVIVSLFIFYPIGLIEEKILNALEITVYRPTGSVDYDKCLSLLFSLKKENEKLPSEISFSENELVQLQSSPPQIEDLNKYYYSKEFIDKISIKNYISNN